MVSANIEVASVCGLREKSPGTTKPNRASHHVSGEPEGPRDNVGSHKVLIISAVSTCTSRTILLAQATSGREPAFFPPHTTPISFRAQIISTCIFMIRRA